MEDLNQRQQEILDYIIKETQIKGYPPSVREIGEAGDFIETIRGVGYRIGGGV